MRSTGREEIRYVTTSVIGEGWALAEGQLWAFPPGSRIPPEFEKYSRPLSPNEAVPAGRKPLRFDEDSWERSTTPRPDPMPEPRLTVEDLERAPYNIPRGELASLRAGGGFPAPQSTRGDGAALWSPEAVRQWQARVRKAAARWGDPD